MYMTCYIANTLITQVDSEYLVLKVDGEALKLIIMIPQYNAPPIYLSYLPTATTTKVLLLHAPVIILFARCCIDTNHH